MEVSEPSPLPPRSRLVCFLATDSANARRVLATCEPDLYEPVGLGVGVWLTPDQVNSNLPKALKLNEIAKSRGQSLAQMAIAWVLRKPAVTSALIGASSVQQLDDNLAALDNLQFSDEELNQIEEILKS